VEQMSQHMLGNRLFAILGPSKAKKPATGKPAGGDGAPGAAKAPASGGIKVPDEVRAAVQAPPSQPAPEAAAPPVAEAAPEQPVNQG
jgi:hypothetical protein